MRLERKDNLTSSKDSALMHNTSFELIDSSNHFFYDFEIINHREAIVYCETLSCPQIVIDEFLFYSGFISQIKNSEGEIIYESDEKLTFKLKIDEIQPSQLYINEEKLHRVLSWIKSPEHIIIPVTKRKGQYVSIDGHTRLKAAQLLGFEKIYVYFDEADSSLNDFIGFCKDEYKFSINDLPIISNSAYEEKWCEFCTAYFKSKEIL